MDLQYDSEGIMMLAAMEARLNAISKVVFVPFYQRESRVVGLGVNLRRCMMLRYLLRTYTFLGQSRPLASD